MEQFTISCRLVRVLVFVHFGREVHIGNAPSYPIGSEPAAQVFRPCRFILRARLKASVSTLPADSQYILTNLDNCNQ
jgi:hypothetical protein